jgi:hypothetical protein
MGKQLSQQKAKQSNNARYTKHMENRWTDNKQNKSEDRTQTQNGCTTNNSCMAPLWDRQKQVCKRPRQIQERIPKSTHHQEVNMNGWAANQHNKRQNKSTNPDATNTGNHKTDKRQPKQKLGQRNTPDAATPYL